jgi:transposase
VTNKVLDILPLHRQSEIWAREGFPIARSTLGELFHRAASLLEPLYLRMLALIATAHVVYADETSLKMQRVKKLGYVWTFATEQHIVYVFSKDRSGETPARVLSDSEGLLVVDGYTGYNHVTMPGKRVRAGCNAHARRKFVDIDDPIAKQIIEHYKTVFEVERVANEQGIVGTERHTELRAAQSRAAMDAIHALCLANRESVGPKTPLGQAMGYVVNQWTSLSRYLTEPAIEPSNNLSERLLRKIALGRKNYLFVGHEDAGRNLAILASLLQSCVLHEIEPQSYIADVLLRVQDHPASRIDELLPANWRPRA